MVPAVDPGVNSYSQTGEFLTVYCQSLLLCSYKSIVSLDFNFSAADVVGSQ